MTHRDDTPDARPKEADFDPYGGCLDALFAWRNFGGLSVAEAYTKFCENPEYYQEDFMFMGGVAFSYYFPVIERYIHDSRADADNDYEVEAMWILAHCIKQQFNAQDTRHVESLRPLVADLVAHVRKNLSKCCVEPNDQRRVDTAWAELQSTLGGTEHAG